MTKFGLLGAAAVVVSSALAGPAMAQQVIYNPGYCAQFYPNANCQNKGPGNPYTGDYQRTVCGSDRRAMPLSRIADRNNGWHDSRDDHRCDRSRPGVAPAVAAAVAGAAVGTAGAIATAPFRGDSYAYDNGVPRLVRSELRPAQRLRLPARHLVQRRRWPPAPLPVGDSRRRRKRRPQGRLSHAGGWTPSRLPATSQILGTSIPLDTGCAKGCTEAPLVMNREIGRPSRALHAAGAARIGQSAAHLVEGRLGILLAKAGVRRPGRGPSRDEIRREYQCNRQPQPACHVASPQPI